MRSDALGEQASWSGGRAFRLQGGVWPVLATPFGEDDSIDWKALHREIDWIVSHGVSGLVIAMVSELTRLDVDERMSLAEAVVEAAAGRVGVVVSVGCESTWSAKRLARHAAGVGAGAIMATAPLIWQISDEDEVVGYFSDLVEAAAGLPLVVQDASLYAGPRLEASVALRLLKRFGPEVVAFKLEGPDAGRLWSTLIGETGGKARIFDGSGGARLPEALQRDAFGTMPGPEAPWALVPAWRALVAGDSDGALGVLRELSLLLAMQTSLESYIAAEKYLLWLQGVLPNTRVRRPAGSVLDSITEELLVRLLRRLQIAARTLAP
jgi:dihydrodipicolinate synthase/N-acetylneuraminate lyase